MILDLTQPAQRTPEWYAFRRNLITASNAYKAFESQSSRNQLIYEKCQPLNPNNYISDEPHPAADETIKHIQLPLAQPQQQNQMVNVLYLYTIQP